MPLNSYFSGSTYTTTTEEEGIASKKFWKCFSVWPLMWVNPGLSPLSSLALQRSFISLLWTENYIHIPQLTGIFQNQPWLSFSSCLHSTSHLVEHSAASGFRVQSEQLISPPPCGFLAVLCLDGCPSSQLVSWLWEPILRTAGQEYRP